MLCATVDRPRARDTRLSLLLELGTMLAREVELDTLLRTIGRRIASALEAERATLYLIDARTGELRSRVADLPELDEIRLPAGRGVAGYVARTGEMVNVHDAARDPRYFSGVDRTTGYVTRNMLAAPIRGENRSIRGVVQVLNKRGGDFREEDGAFLVALAAQVAYALDRTTLRPERRSAPGVDLRGPFNHIVGDSPPMKIAYDQVLRAASTDAIVLLRGETGVGKGLFARAIHTNCRRHDGPFVVVDCATLPPSLAESELFGHERGAYTSADRRVQGKVELAEGGTLFLDEIGELPLPTQAKLLRFLHDRTFERVGGRTTLSVDVRIIAATHRDLASLVAKGGFRQDLFYRLRVIEIWLPNLRDRGPDEIEALCHHFVGVYCRRHGRHPVHLHEGALERLRNHPWPGNVRELEHSIERAVVLAPEGIIHAEHLGLDDDGTNGLGGHTSSAMPETSCCLAPRGVVLPFGLPLAEVARRYVAATLEACDGNQTQAARALKVGRNTLRRKALKGA